MALEASRSIKEETKKRVMELLKPGGSGGQEKI